MNNNQMPLEIIITLSIIAVVIVIIISMLIRFILNNSKKSGNISELYEDEAAYNKASEQAETEENFDKAYFDQIEKGEPFQLFLILGGQKDCSLIRSYLAGNGIPSFVENENINRIYGGISAGVAGIFAIKLYILIKDYDQAYEALCEFTKTENKQSESSDSENTDSEKSAGLFFAPYPSEVEQKSNGITVLPKKKI